MIIANVHMNSPIELRFVISDNIDGRDRFTTRFIFVDDNMSPLEVAAAIANNVNLYEQVKAQDFPYDYNEADHIAGILADAPRYGCD